MEHFEDLGNGWRISVSPKHKFGTDAFLLADFARPRNGCACCDLGSGCGIIPTLWLRWGYTPGIAYAVELQEQAFNQMQATVAANNELEGVMVPVWRDLRKLNGEIPPGSIELVSCNPPYKQMGRGVPCPDAARLAARHEVSCSLSDICRTASRLLRHGGRLAVCQRPERLPDIVECMRSVGIEPKRLRFVHHRPEKAPWLLLIEGRRGGRSFLSVEPPLFMENPDGSPTAELLQIYRKQASLS